MKNVATGCCILKMKDAYKYWPFGDETAILYIKWANGGWFSEAPAEGKVGGAKVDVLKARCAELTAKSADPALLQLL